MRSIFSALLAPLLVVREVFLVLLLAHLDRRLELHLDHLLVQLPVPLLDRVTSR